MSGRAALAIGAIGVVYGDIGTNPLFAMREAFVGGHELAVSDANVLGLLSLMFWSLPSSSPSSWCNGMARRAWAGCSAR